MKSDTATTRWLAASSSKAAEQRRAVEPVNGVMSGVASFDTIYLLCNRAADDVPT